MNYEMRRQFIQFSLVKNKKEREMKSVGCGNIFHN